MSQYRWLNNHNNLQEYYKLKAINCVCLKPIGTAVWNRLKNDYLQSPDIRVWKEEHSRLKIDIFWKYIDLFLKYIFVNLEGPVLMDFFTKKFLKALADGIIQIRYIKMAQTQYYTYYDSKMSSSDVIWQINNKISTIHQICSMWEIQNLSKVDFFQYLDASKFKNIDHLVLSFGLHWDVVDNKSANLKSYTDGSICLCTPTKTPEIVNLRHTVQQLYVAHQHIEPKRGDFIGCRNSLIEFPSDAELRLDNFRTNAKEDEDYSQERLPICSFGTQCAIHKIWNCFNCCMNSKKTGETIYSCCYDAHPFFYVYSAWQGYVPRWSQS